MDTVKIRDKRKTLMIAHRGLSGIETENTLTSFTAACNRSYFGVECDVHVTKDGRYVIFHDDDTGRLCTENAVIENTDFNTLRALKFKDGVSQMPTLEEHLSLMSRFGKTAVIELKNYIPVGNIAEIIKICEKLYSLDKIIFISFDFSNLVAVRNLLPEQNVQFLTDRCDSELIAKLNAYRMGIDIGYWALNAKIIKELHKNNVTVNCWTCDDKFKAQELISLGVDFITTNILE